MYDRGSTIEDIYLQSHPSVKTTTLSELRYQINVFNRMN